MVFTFINNVNEDRALLIGDIALPCYSILFNGFLHTLPMNGIYFREYAFKNNILVLCRTRGLGIRYILYLDLSS